MTQEGEDRHDQLADIMGARSERRDSDRLSVHVSRECRPEMGVEELADRCTNSDENRSVGVFPPPSVDMAGVELLQRSTIGCTAAAQ